QVLSKVIEECNRGDRAFALDKVEAVRGCRNLYIYRPSLQFCDGLTDTQDTVESDILRAYCGEYGHIHPRIDLGHFRFGNVVPRRVRVQRQSLLNLEGPCPTMEDHLHWPCLGFRQACDVGCCVT